MRRSKNDKALSHREIVEQAAYLFREHGIDQTSIADVMQAAKMTHGGFYRHFQSKDELVGASINQAIAEVLAELGGKPSTGQEHSVLDSYVSTYLSQGHASNPRIGCPVAALAVDVGRIGGGLAATTAGGINRIIAAIASHLPGSKHSARAQGAVMFATLVGAVVIARASGNSEVGQEVLAACRKHLDV